MRSYVVKRLPHFRHSRRRRIDSASLLSRESTTLSFANPQKGHFMARQGCLGRTKIVTAAGRNSGMAAIDGCGESQVRYGRGGERGRRALFGEYRLRQIPWMVHVISLV